MISILYLVFLLPCVLNVGFSICAAWCFRKHPRPPVWVIIFLLILGAGTIRLIFMVPFGYSITLVTVPSAILSIIQALALLCRRQFGTGFRRSWGISCLIVLPVVVWADLRFSVLVVDVDGNAVEVDTSQIQMQASSSSFLSWGYTTVVYGYGNRLKKGVVYFGFCQWVTRQEHWLVWGDAVSPEGKILRRKKIDSKASWGNLPLRITVDPQAP